MAVGGCSPQTRNWRNWSTDNVEDYSSRRLGEVPQTSVYVAGNRCSHTSRLVATIEGTVRNAIVSFRSALPTRDTTEHTDVLLARLDCKLND